MTPMSALRHLVVAGIAAASFAATAFPTKPVTIVVPFGAGSVTDSLARDIGKVLSEQVGQPVVVENRTGAEGLIGAQSVLTAPADGHTLMFTSSSLTVLDPLMKKQLPYNPSKDFAPICGVGSNDNDLNVSVTSPYKTLPEFIAAAKASPGKLTFGHASATTRLAGELFSQAAGVKLTAVPYRTTIAGLTDVAGGQIDAFFVDHVSTAALRQSGKIRALTVAGDQRLKAMPDVPSSKEQGLPDHDPKSFFAFYASANTPADITQKLRQIVAQLVKSPAIVDLIDKRALIPVSMCGDALSQHIVRETERMRAVIERAGIEKQ